MLQERSPVFQTTHVEPVDRPACAVLVHDVFRQLALFAARHTHQRERHAAEPERDQPPANRRHDVILALRNRVLDDLDLAFVEPIDS